MLKDLIRIANELDRRGLTREADELDSMVKEAIAPLVAAAAVALCFAGGCKEVSKDELSAATGIDFEFEYDEDGNTIDVNPVCDTGGTDCAEKNVSSDSITLTWPCGEYEFLKDVLHMEAGQAGSYYVSISWQLDSAGYIMVEDTRLAKAEVSSC